MESISETKVGYATKRYVVDTGVLIDYPNIIFDDRDPSMDEATLDLSQQEIFIPAAVISQLSKFKNEDSNRGNSAKYVLSRLEKLGANRMVNMGESYKLNNPIMNGLQKIHIVTLPSDFGSNLVYQPDKDDIDGQIILAAIYVYNIFAPSYDITNIFDTTELSYFDRVLEECGLENVSETTEVPSLHYILKAMGVEILTNKKELAILAREHGVDAREFRYKQKTYTGYRELVVPKDLYYDFLESKSIHIDTWKEFMPEQPDLEANEFVVMTPNQEKDISELEQDQRQYQHIGRYDLESKCIVPLKYFKSSSLHPKNNGQAMLMEAILHPDIDAVIAYGPAGTGKTFLASVLGYESCSNGNYIDVTIVPAHVENDGVGYLPGDLNEKLDPNVQPIKNALRNYFIENDKDIRKRMTDFTKNGAKNKAESKRNSDQQSNKSIKSRVDNLVELTWSNWFNNIPIAYARGRDFAHEFVIYDEFQDQDKTKAQTLVSRIGKESKIIITGDIEQVHAPYLDQDNNGLVHAKKMLTGLPTTAQIELKDDEIVRHPLVRQIIKSHGK